jgi:hypothetical protein
MVALAAWNAIGVDRIPHSERRDRRIVLVVLPILGFLAFFRYLPMLAHATSSSPKEKSYLAGRTFVWAIALLDLGIFPPRTVAACVGVARETPGRTRRRSTPSPGASQGIQSVLAFRATPFVFQERRDSDRDGGYA